MRCFHGFVRQVSTTSRRLTRAATTFLLVGFIPVAAAATPEAAVPSMAGSVARVIGALGLVFGLFLGAIWLARNWPRLLSRPVRTPELRVIECRALGGRQAIWVVGYRQQRLLVASSPTGVTLLTQLPDAAAAEVEPAPAADFAVAFQHLLGQRG